MKFPSKRIALQILFHSAFIYDIVRQVRGKTMESNFSSNNFEGGGEAIETKFFSF